MKQRIFSIRNSDEGRRASAEILEAYGSRRTPSSRRRVSRYQSTALTKQTQENSAKGSDSGVKDSEQPSQSANDNISKLNPQMTLDF